MTLALSVASARGIDYGEATEEQRRSCHRIARACLPGANKLIADERVNTQAELGESFAEAMRVARRKTYDDAFEDGQKNDYNNRFMEEDEWQIREDELSQRG